MPRVARVFGQGPQIGSLPYASYDTYPSSAVFEASPIYTSITVALRIWGTRSRTSSGVTTTETIDQTEEATFTRVAPVANGVDAMRQVSPEPTPGDAATRGIVSFTNGGPGMASRFGFSAAALGVTTAPVLYLDGGEVAYSSGVGLPNPRQQRLRCSGSAARTFTFSRTVTPPGTTTDVDVDIFLAAPAWSFLTPIPSFQRGAQYAWGYGAPEIIDTSAWSATKWRDYRGEHVFPARSLVDGLWTSGDMQQQYTVVLG